MLTLEIFSTEQHKRFINRVIDKSQVWALTTNDNWVFSTSNKDGAEDVGVFTVWSDEAYAKRCAIDAWVNYAPKSIPLGEFLESWCVGLHNNQELVGTNWDKELHGLEIEPLELVLQILAALRANDKTVELKKYPYLQDFEILIRENLG